MEWEEYRKGKIRERKREKRGKQCCLLEIIFDCDAWQRSGAEEEQKYGVESPY